MQNRGASCHQMHKLHLYWHEMQHFAKVLHEYIANQVITVLWHEFQHNLEEFLDGIDDLCRIHADYIDKSLSRLVAWSMVFCRVMNSSFSKIPSHFSPDLQTFNRHHRIRLKSFFSLMGLNFISLTGPIYCGCTSILMSNHLLLTLIVS